MKLREFLKDYYSCGDVRSTFSQVYRELCLPGAYSGAENFRKTISWNLDRDVYFREATKYEGKPGIYVILTTGKMDFFPSFDSEEEFQGYLDSGLKKHRSYRRDYLAREDGKTYLFYSRKYE